MIEQTKTFLAKRQSPVYNQKTVHLISTDVAEALT